MPIPIYLKTDPQMPRPADSEFYWVARNGTFLCRNHPFFESDVPTDRRPQALAEHQPRCLVQFPKLRRSMLEYIVGFFARVYELHRSESVVLLYWDMQRQRYRLLIPDQQATVWESWSGQRTPEDVSYEVPVLPPQYLLVGDIHCHGNFAAFSSGIDKADERYRDGVHAVVGYIEDEPPQFHLQFAVDGSRFNLSFEQVFAGYERRRRLVPEQWLGQVGVVVQKAKTYTWWSGSASQSAQRK